MVSIIIPSRKEKYLQQTIDSLIQNARGDIEIVAILDGYWPDPPLKEDSRIKIIHRGSARGLRDAVNSGVALSSGDYIMKIDAHCMFDEGYDIKLIADYQEDAVVVPRRYKLDVVNWKICEDDAEPIDYEKLIVGEDRIYGQQWPSRAKKRAEHLIDENMVFQGSCWFMSRKHWNKIGPLQEEGYGSFIQEPIEIALKTWLGGGKVLTNKKTWYAHQHRKFGRTHQINENEAIAGNLYSRDFWMNNKWPDRVHDFEWLVKKFNCNCPDNK